MHVGGADNSSRLWSVVKPYEGHCPYNALRGRDGPEARHVAAAYPTVGLIVGEGLMGDDPCTVNVDEPLGDHRPGRVRGR